MRKYNTGMLDPMRPTSVITSKGMPSLFELKLLIQQTFIFSIWFWCKPWPFESLYLSTWSKTNLIEPTKNQWLVLGKNTQMKLLQKSSFNEIYLLINNAGDKEKLKMWPLLRGSLHKCLIIFHKTLQGNETCLGQRDRLLLLILSRHLDGHSQALSLSAPQGHPVPQTHLPEVSPLPALLSLFFQLLPLLPLHSSFTLLPGSHREPLHPFPCQHPKLICPLFSRAPILKPLLWSPFHS